MPAVGDNRKQRGLERPWIHHINGGAQYKHSPAQPGLPGSRHPGLPFRGCGEGSSGCLLGKRLEKERGKGGLLVVPESGTGAI